MLLCLVINKPEKQTSKHQPDAKHNELFAHSLYSFDLATLNYKLFSSTAVTYKLNPRI